MNVQVESALNELLNAELWSSGLHLQVQAYLEKEGMPVLASWMNLQARKKSERFRKLAELVLRGGGRVAVRASVWEHTGWQSPLEAFDALLGHERYMRRLAGSLRKLASCSGEDVCGEAQLLYEDEMDIGRMLLELIRMLAKEGERRLPFDVRNN